jgi:signal transduction histidine kinase
MLIAAFAMLAAVTGLGFARAPSDWVRWTSLILSILFGLVMFRMPRPGSPEWHSHLYLAVQAGLVTALMIVHEDWTIYTLLFFILSGQAVLVLSPRLGSAWIAGFAVISAVVGLIRWGWTGALLAVLLYAAGYAFFGLFAYALNRAEAARSESQALLADLQEAHQQLQQYAARVEELAVVEERNRVAREMHDTLGHRLTVAAVQLEGAQRLCAMEPERAALMVGTVREQVSEALRELRATVATLRIPIEAELRLRDSLTRLVSHFEEATNLTVFQDLPEEMPPLSSTHRLALYRAAQEALSNVQNHAQAKHVWLLLTADESSVTLMVSDDGRGPTLTAPVRGFGLRGLRERAAQLQGDMHLEPRLGGGTQLTFRLPLAQETADG